MNASQLIDFIEKNTSNTLSLKGLLQDKTIDEIEQILAAIPHSMTAVDLSENNLGSRFELTRLFSAIPRPVRTLNLSTNSFTSYAHMPAIAAIPLHVDLDISNHAFSAETLQLLIKQRLEMAAALSKIKVGGKVESDTIRILRDTLKWAKKYDVHNACGYGECLELQRAINAAITLSECLSKVSTKLSLDITKSITVDEIVAFFSAVSKSVTALEFSCDDCLNAKTVAELIRIFAAIPPSVTSVEFPGEILNPTIAQAFSAIPRSVTTLKLPRSGYHALRNKSITELAQIFTPIPGWVTTLDLSWSALKAVELMQIFKVMPKSISTLDLSCNNLHLEKPMTGVELMQMLKALPKTVACLNLYGHSLGDKTCGELEQAFKAIPASLKVLDLSYNNFWKKTVAELLQIFKALPQSLVVLKFSSDIFKDRTAAEVVQIIKALPRSVTTLELSHGILRNKTAVELGQIFAAIPSWVTVLNLSGNGLGGRTDEELSQILGAIPAFITTLNLSDNFMILPRRSLVQLFAAIPRSVKTLHFAHNDCFDFCSPRGGDNDLAHALAALPPSVITLDLSGNEFGIVGENALSSTLAVIPQSVTSLNLSNNKLAQKTDRELSRIFAAIPSHVRNINILDNDFSIDRLRSIIAQPLEAALATIKSGGKANPENTLAILRSALDFVRYDKDNALGLGELYQQVASAITIFEGLVAIDTGMQQFAKYSFPSCKRPLYQYRAGILQQKMDLAVQKFSSILPEDKLFPIAQEAILDLAYSVHKEPSQNEKHDAKLRRLKFCQEILGHVKAENQDTKILEDRNRLSDEVERNISSVESSLATQSVISLRRGSSCN